MAEQQPNLQSLRLLGGRLCIDFVNTIENRAGKTPHDFITSYTGLVEWSRHAGQLDDADETQLMALAAGNLSATERAWRQALELREALHRALLAIATHGEPTGADLRIVQRAYERSIAGSELTPADGAYRWTWTIADLARPLWPVAHSAIELLTESELRRVKVCANPHSCGWLFYDHSKNASRRWCRMEGCGSQSKMRRQYAKRRAELALSPETE